ncbi:hypothetical protein CRV02_13325 [Arcobacter sp. CECT 8989]|uniref:hypothetical protein n=1 Tax=Arcobacter sp. CECT 8989 TaxID=2044509 RepID=UPI00100AF64C|nr:hypothetical protein [Arcobacter sp. CECT 8989]RXJ98468.1 hypothetical protein CRV02_13325 [Arcobacter sp. CECT 8989]
MKDYKRKDENEFHFEFIGVKIEKFNKGSAFNKHNENIYVNYSFGKRDSTFRLRAVRRLARYLRYYVANAQSYFKGF